MKKIVSVIVSSAFVGIIALSSAPANAQRGDARVNDNKEKPACQRTCDQCQGPCTSWSNDEPPFRQCLSYSFYECNCRCG